MKYPAVYKINYSNAITVYYGVYVQQAASLQINFYTQVENEDFGEFIIYMYLKCRCDLGLIIC